MPRRNRNRRKKERKEEFEKKEKEEKLIQKAKEIRNATIEARRVAAQLQLMAGQLGCLANHILAETKKYKNIKRNSNNSMTFVKIYCTNRVFQYKSFLLVKKNSSPLRRTCTEYVANKHISRILKNLFLFHRIHTYASIHRFPILHNYLCEIYHPYWFCTGFQLAGTPSTVHSKHSSPPCTSISPHHPQNLLAQGSTLF